MSAPPWCGKGRTCLLAATLSSAITVGGECLRREAQDKAAVSSLPLPVLARLSVQRAPGLPAPRGCQEGPPREPVKPGGCPVRTRRSAGLLLLLLRWRRLFPVGPGEKPVDRAAVEAPEVKKGDLVFSGGAGSAPRTERALAQMRDVVSLKHEVFLAALDPEHGVVCEMKFCFTCCLALDLL